MKIRVIREPNKCNAYLITKSYFFKSPAKLSEEKIVQAANGEEEEEHSLTKIVGNKKYNVDFNEKIIYQQEMVIEEENPLLNLKDSDTLISMGAKRVGTESILGYKCDIWQLGEDKIWIYNTVPLKLISKSLGLVQIQEAKLAVFNVDIKDDKFKLPSFPVKAVDDVLNIGPEGEISHEQDN